MVKTVASSRKTWLEHQENKIGEVKLIQSSVKVSFQDQGNPQKM